MATVLRIEWQSSPPAEFVTSYKLWQSVNGGSNTLLTTTPNTFHEITNPGPNQYSFIVQATNFVGSSPNSPPGSAPGIPTVLPAPVVTVTVV